MAGDSLYYLGLLLTRQCSCNISLLFYHDCIVGGEGNSK